MNGPRSDPPRYVEPEEPDNGPTMRHYLKSAEENAGKCRSAIECAIGVNEKQLHDTVAVGAELAEIAQLVTACELRLRALKEEHTPEGRA